MRSIKNAFALSCIAASFSAFAEPTEITVWEDLGKSASLEEAASEFTAQTGIKVNFIELRYIYVLERLRLDGPAGTGPDILLLPNDQIAEAVEEGMIEPIDTRDSAKEKYLDIAIEACTYDKQLYAIPTAVETLAVFYNKNDLYKPYDHLEDYYNYSKAMRKLDRYGLVGSFTNLYYGMSVLEPYGAYLYAKDDEGNYDTKDIGMANKGAIEGIKAFKKFYSEGILPYESAGLGGVYNCTDLFIRRKAAALVTGTYDISTCKKAGLDFGVAPLPILPNGKHMSAFLGVRGYAISRWSENVEAAYKFINFINSKEYSIQRFEKSYDFPALTEALYDPRVKDNEFGKAFIEQAKYSYPMPSTYTMANMWKIFEDALNKAYSPKTTNIEQVMDVAVQKAKGDRF